MLFFPRVIVVCNTKLKIMVSSTVDGSETDLDAIYSILEGFGYEVISSRKGSIYVPVNCTIEEACLKAVEDCDLFLGILFPRYGSGITHKEFLKAEELGKPRWFIAHHYVTFARKLLRQFMFDEDDERIEEFEIKSTSVLDSVKVIDMYNDIKSKWAQPFFKTCEVHPFINTQFKDIKMRERELEEIQRKKNEE